MVAELVVASYELIKMMDEYDHSWDDGYDPHGSSDSYDYQRDESYGYAGISGPAPRNKNADILLSDLGQSSPQFLLPAQASSSTKRM